MQPPGGAAPAPRTGSEWQVLFSEQRLDCLLSIEDMSPGMPWGRAKFQVGSCWLTGWVRGLVGGLGQDLLPWLSIGAGRVTEMAVGSQG